MILAYENVDFSELTEGNLLFETSSVKLPSKWKCPCCKKPYISKEAMYNHMYKEHSNELPDQMSAAQYAFNIRNKKTFGICVQCKINKTEWSEDAERYDRFCGSRCKDAYVITAKTRMMKKYGREHLLNDPEIQMKMQDSRSISGIHKFQADNGEVQYLGSYEKDFLEYIDDIYGWKATEVMRCPEVFDYEYEGKKVMYMPDYYLPNFNLIVEIKSGGDNPNNHHKYVAVDKVKEKLKDEIMEKQTEYNYIKVVNKEYKTFDFIIKAIRSMNWTDPDFKNKTSGIVIIPE